MSLIKAEDLSLGYDSKVVASGINFEVNNGEYLCIVGENGSGKSTLMKSLLGLLKPLGGSITFGDGLKQTEIGYLPQRTDIQMDFPASCWEVVISGTLNSMGLRPFYSKKEKAIAKKNMELLGIEDFVKRSFQDLSGGQQQRVLLARALCATQKLVLLDEPVTGLDPMVTAEMYDVIKELNRKHGITVIMVSHDLNGSLDGATHILQLQHKPLFCGTKEDYLKSDIGVRYTGGAK